MIVYYYAYLCKGILWIMLLILACASYAYLVNQRRDDHDPKKRNYSPYAILIAPITLPLLLLLAIFVFLLRAALFCLFLMIFTIALVVIRKPFIFVWLNKMALGIGEPLLKINTYLIRLALGPWSKGTEPL